MAQPQTQPQPQSNEPQAGQIRPAKDANKAFPKAKKTLPSTQEFLNISEIRDGVIVLKNGGLKTVMMTSSMNFALKSTQEQEAIVRSFQRFLNSLNDPIQILIQSRQLDIDAYIQKLREIERQQTNELLRIQTYEYRNYIKELVGLARIMSKRFFVVVSFTSVKAAVKVGIGGRIRSFIRPEQNIVQKRQSFEEDRKRLYERVDHVGATLSEAGLRSIVLNTQELIELLYSSYNPTTSQSQDLGEIDEIDLG